MLRVYSTKRRFKLATRKGGYFFRLGLLVVLIVGAGRNGMADIVVQKVSEDQWRCSVWLTDMLLEETVVRLGQVEVRGRVSQQEGEVNSTLVGHPALPEMTYKILLPRGYKVADVVPVFKDVSRKILPRKLAFVPDPITSDDYADPEKRRAWEASLDEDAEIFSADSFYPPQRLRYEEKIHRGYQVLYLTVNPFEYNPVTGELRYSQKIDCAVTLKEQAPEDQIEEKFIRKKKRAQDFIRRMVVNPEELATYIKEN